MCCTQLARVDAVLHDLGLTDCADTLIGNWFFKGISGGQVRSRGS